MNVFLAIETGSKLVPQQIWLVGKNLKVQEIVKDFAHFYTEKYREYVIVYFQKPNHCGVYFMVDTPKYPYDPSKR